MVILTAFVLVIVLVIIIKFKWFIHTDCKSKVCLVGKTALVTGGNSGIGYEIVLGLLQRGCKVIVADIAKDQHLFENIFKETGSKNVVYEYVDLASFKSIRELANNVKKRVEKLDVLIHNAGVGGYVLKPTEDGLDLVLQINYFSGFLLTHLLVDLLKKAKGRIIFTSSGMAYFHNFSMKALKPEGISATSYFHHYQNSKLLLILVGDMFGEKLKKYGVTSNTYHPGMARTNIFQSSLDIKGNWNWVWFFIKLGYYTSWIIGNTPEEAAQTPIYLACATEVENVTAKFFFECKQTIKPRLVHNKKVCQAIWEATEDLVKLAPQERLS